MHLGLGLLLCASKAPKLEGPQMYHPRVTQNHVPRVKDATPPMRPWIARVKGPSCYPLSVAQTKLAVLLEARLKKQAMLEAKKEEAGGVCA